MPLPRPKLRLRLRLLLRHPHRKRRSPQGLPRLRPGRRLCHRRKPPDLLPQRLPQLPLPDQALRRPRLPSESVSTARRSSAAWPRNTVSISPPFPVPVRVAASASKISKLTSPVALSRQPKPPSPPRQPSHLRYRLRNAPPPLPHRRLLPPAARCTSPSSPPCPAKKCTSATTKCSP